MTSRHIINHVHLVRRIVSLGQLDWIQACEIVSTLLDVEPNLSPEELTENALSLIGYLLHEQLLEPGDVTEPGGFIPWTEPPGIAHKLIVTSWHSLGRLPNLGEICWFRNTRAGDQLALCEGD